MDIVLREALLWLHSANIDKDSYLVTDLRYTKLWEIADHMQALITLCDEKLCDKHVPHLSCNSFFEHMEHITGWEPVR